MQGGPGSTRDTMAGTQHSGTKQGLTSAPSGFGHLVPQGCSCLPIAHITPNGTGAVTNNY